ncbi:two-component sensor histidine kinase [Virgisporangium aliadipatigenens]|uniref:histidine kinase n=1 Tax=Virgisporangium aliadipatigenens TaxID=741659 RepID=A0A8J3YSG8_9ACTN|nr:HAMP domain-containing sensor histidine kinase [Virgisporangium aliadipatigenens]GIJ48923.1 two-component sensor histidine kinase [Virgisporangium aliadipatigenens]
MSSSPPAERRWRPSTWSLRTRLLAVMTLLLAAVSLAIGAVTAVAMRDFLIEQVDGRLADASMRSGFGGPRPNGGGASDASDQLGRAGNAPGTVLVLRRTDGTVVDAKYIIPHSATTADESTTADVPADALEVLLGVPVDGRARTVDLGELGEYRVQAMRWAGRGNGPDRMPERITVTGLSLAETNATIANLLLVEALVTLIALAAALLGGQVVIRRNLRPLRRVAATAGRVAELPLHAGDVALAERVPAADTDPRTEVGQVGAALNRLLGHVDAALAARHASETRLRQFAADASHELRTPLAAIRGYAELGRRSAAQSPPEVNQVLERVEAAATRMTTLVEDLLLLARLDAGRPLERDAVDLSALVVESLSDAHAAGPQHRWRLDLPDEPVEVVGDDARLHQVIGNLLTNARTHTPPGTTVQVGLSTVDGAAVVSVVDDGPGIPPDLQPAVFQRFARGDSARSRTAGSTGLGLSIVAAVVAAHGGTVEVRSVPGRTEFTVRLPLFTDGAQVGHTVAIAAGPTVES